MCVDRIPLYVSDALVPGPNEEFIRLEPTQFELVDAVMTRNVSVRASFETIARHVFAAGMEVMSTAFPITTQMREQFNGPWLRFCRDVALYMFAYGFILVRIREEDKVPVALNPLEFEITVVRKPHSQRMYRLVERPTFSGNRTIFPSRMRKPVTDVMIWEKNAPDFMGRLTSVVPTLMQTNSMVNLMLACAAKAEVRRAVPALFLEHVAETPESKQLAMDIGIPGNNNMMHAAALELEAGEDLQRIQQNEENIRRGNLMQLGNIDAAVDPVNGQIRYPVDPNGLPFFNVPVPLPQRRKLVQNTASESPQFLMEFLQFSEEDVAKITGVPSGLFGTSQSNIASNITTMNIFYATQQDTRMMLTTIINELIRMVFGAQTLLHAFAKYAQDPTLDAQKLIADHEVQAMFPGLLDPEILNMFQDRGAMHWDQWCVYAARYFGVPREHLAEKQLDVASDRPLEAVAMEQKAEEDLMALALKKQQTQGQGTKRKAAGGGGGGTNGPMMATAEKSAMTRASNAKKLGKRTKRPGSAVPGVPRGADVRT